MSADVPATEDREDREDLTVEDRRGYARGPHEEVLKSFLFVVLECDRPLAGGARYALDDYQEVTVGRGPVRAAKGLVTAEGINRLRVRLPGAALSAQHAQLRRVEAGWWLEDAASTNGTYVNGDRVQGRLLGNDDFVEVGRTLLAVRTVPLPARVPARDLDWSAGGAGAFPAGFFTLDPLLGLEFSDLERIAVSPISVVLCGETGTGKEVVARSLHALSRRRGPFVAVNCGALVRGLAESQLFGHVKGAFSGAIADASGFFRAAAGGTIVLDEVADLDPAVQVSLLRVLQEHEVVAVGGARPQSVDVRVIAATPSPLPDLVRAGRFRADLLARLAGFTFVTPPLRDRCLDLGVLVASLLSKNGVTASDNIRFAPEAAWRLLRHPWPLNIRSLEQLLLRSRVLAPDGLITSARAQFPDPAELTPSPTRLPAEPRRPSSAALSAGDLKLMAELEKELTAAQGNVAEVARQRGTARMQVYRWLHRFGIDARAFRGQRR